MLKPVAGYLMIFAGAGHLFLASMTVIPRYLELARLGWFATVPPPWQEGHFPDRQILLWTGAGSFAVPYILLGLVVVRLWRAGVDVPKAIGPAALVFGLFAATLAPQGGFWVVALPGALLIIDDLRTQRVPR